ncbi:hypothetical protein [Spiroplasma floricola]|uniref:hypothetical protein n=1 Tax=Spiroplasma floricola TaxID=216937 RepID=UPI000C2D3E62|nr:hypothetical protein [Spiroplasma floricola]
MKRKWKYDSNTNEEEISKYLEGVYSFGQFTLSNLKVKYAGSEPISLGTVMIPFTYKSQYTTVSSNNISKTSVKAKEYLTHLAQEFHNLAEIVKIDDSTALSHDNALGQTKTTVKNPLWDGLELPTSSSSYYTTFKWKDYNESLKKMTINNQNNILQFNFGISDTVSRTTKSYYMISNTTTYKQLRVNLGFFRYYFGFTGALFYCNF